MPSAANPKSEKPASSEATDNSPVRQVLTIIEHKIRNLEKRKSKLTSYRDLQKSGKELNADQKIAVAKYDEVAQTLEFARDLSKQITSIAISTEKEAKKQAKRDTWIRYGADTTMIREVLLILDCLTQMGNAEARDDFLNGTNGAAKLTEEDLKILDDLYPEVTPKHEANEEGQAGFPGHTTKAAEHIYAIIDGKPKEALGTTYAHIKEIIMTVHSCGYFDKVESGAAPEPLDDDPAQPEEAAVVPVEAALAYAPAALAAPLPAAPAPAGLPAPAYPLRPLPPITLQEVEHAYFAQQYPQQRPIAEVIGSQNFFFLQESEIDSPVGTPQPPLMNPPSPGPIPTQTFTNQHYVPIPEPGPLPIPPPHFQAPYVPLAAPLPPPPQLSPPQPAPQPPPQPQARAPDTPPPEADKNDDEWQESRSPERDDGGERKTQGQGDGQGRFRRYGRGGPRGASNGYRGRGGFRQNDGYQRHGEFQPRANKDYQPRQYNDNYQSRNKDYHGRSGDYYGNGDAGEHHENGASQSYGGGFKSRGRGGARGRAQPRARAQFARNKPDHADQ